jgi:hypothetical protein
VTAPVASEQSHSAPLASCLPSLHFLFSSVRDEVYCRGNSRQDRMLATLEAPQGCQPPLQMLGLGGCYQQSLQERVSRWSYPSGTQCLASLRFPQEPSREDGRALARNRHHLRTGMAKKGLLGAGGLSKHGLRDSYVK